MNHPDPHIAAEKPSGESTAGESDGATGLPWPQTWGGVYVFILGCFILFVILLAVLTRAYS